MKFVVSSTDLLRKLQSISKVVNPKNTLPILDNFLFELQEEKLVITASDLETTLVTSLELDNVEGGGKFALEAKRLIDILKEFSDQPLSFDVNEETMDVDILSENGKFSVVGIDGEDFPEPAELEEDKSTAFKITGRTLHRGIIKTIFATADDELRPVMNGIFMELKEDSLTFVASDSHKLVRYRREDVKAGKEASFILPKKPAEILKSTLVKDDEDVTIEFDEKNAIFEFANFKIVCRLIEGDYPNYESVIPINNENKMTVDRVEFYNTIKRVAIFANEASRLVKFKITPTQVTVSAQDIDFSISAYERITCQYEGEDMTIGFKASFFQDVLNNLSAPDIVVEMSEPSKATLVFPIEKSDEYEDELMLIMPMMLDSE